MSHTIRAYNRHPLRLGPGYRGWLVSNRIDEQTLYRFMWGDYHPWRQWGRMRGWRDWRLRVRRRQANKLQLREISWEYAPFGLFLEDYYTFDI